MPESQDHGSREAEVVVLLVVIWLDAADAAGAATAYR